MPQLTQTNRSGTRSRRRGEVLERALYEATLAELAEVGYGGLTMEGIAARAHTGKAALYRRWCSKHDLVHAALVYALPPLPELRSGRSARENLLTMLTSHRDLLAGKTGFPGVDIVGQLVHEPELRAIVAELVVGPRVKILEEILAAAVDDGDLDPAAVTPLTAKIGPALINQYFLLTGEPPNRRELALVVDTVIPPRAASGD
jgi:AcrR family transcriptional regulator